jgi:hypothetical protein
LLKAFTVSRFPATQGIRNLRYNNFQGKFDYCNSKGCCFNLKQAVTLGANLPAVVQILLILLKYFMAGNVLSFDVHFFTQKVKTQLSKLKY